ncbi:putative bifunctional diguanylate cyclase/phosphodiesterase [Sphingobium boeckii]|uniref:Diguanylate cyclase (GGDEF)-like protein/PAS domain S-box-containing protein n=1 Tax=Sphingobium boeckii TaxID=1082345 RepID=A0A7W9EFU9_9SPHN|nr:EAL domain-containing protein [Sphingobium boeckii]MBB5686091.1 diguanylate cyclase (GGDEF)-like protein/PAS domain S-box-containing protein [Sphingobium boeckii]
MNRQRKDDSERQTGSGLAAASGDAPHIWVDSLPQPLISALDAAGIAIAYRLPESRTVIFSDAAQRLLDVKPSTTIERALRTVGRKYRRRLADFVTGKARHPDAGGLSRIIVPLLFESGVRKWLELSMSADPAGGGEYLILRDCTEDTDTRRRLEREREHLRHTVELNPQLPWLADAQGNIIAFTERYEIMTGRTAEELTGNGWALITHPDDRERAMEQTAHSVATGDPLDTRVRVRTADGAYRWMRVTAYCLRDDEGKILRWFGYTEDIDDHVLIEQQIRWTAEHDALTRLPNRMVFNRQLEDALTSEYQLGQKIAVLLADVDNFKDVNDVLGHDSGDALLIGCGESIGRALPPGSMLSRIGGDEFAIILPFDGAVSVLNEVCDRIFAAMRDPLNVNGQSVECRVSIGAAIFPFHGQSPTELFKNADIALYQAKARGRGQMTVFSLEMKQETQRRVAMVNLGRKAVESDSIIPYYQLQVSLEENRPIGFEALLRRRDRQGRICAPSSISAAFEDAEVAEAIGDAMLKAVLADMQMAENRGVDLGTVSVNFSTAEFRSATFIDRLTNRIADAGIDFSRVMIEVTEGVFLGRPADSAAQTIRTLHDLGFKIALDDFGTGYASLVHLRQLPVDTLKIDQSFIRALVDSKDDLAIVSAILNLGASLGLNVIAEGIESEAQLSILRGLKLRYAQGYLFAHPVPIEEAFALALPWQTQGHARDQAHGERPGIHKRMIGWR